jgi:hypothetical protein
MDLMIQINDTCAAIGKLTVLRCQEDVSGAKQARRRAPTPNEARSGSGRVPR